MGTGKDISPNNDNIDETLLIFTTGVLMVNGICRGCLLSATQADKYSTVLPVI